jgi:hypothetical protein
MSAQPRHRAPGHCEEPISVLASAMSRTNDTHIRHPLDPVGVVFQPCEARTKTLQAHARPCLQR